MQRVRLRHTRICWGSESSVATCTLPTRHWFTSAPVLETLPFPLPVEPRKFRRSSAGVCLDFLRPDKFPRSSTPCGTDAESPISCGWVLFKISMSKHCPACEERLPEVAILNPPYCVLPCVPPPFRLPSHPPISPASGFPDPGTYPSLRYLRCVLETKCQLFSVINVFLTDDPFQCLPNYGRKRLFPALFLFIGATGVPRYASAEAGNSRPRWGGPSAHENYVPYGWQPTALDP